MTTTVTIQITQPTAATSAPAITVAPVQGRTVPTVLCEREALEISLTALDIALELGRILKKYEAENDDLSKNILVEGRKLTAYVLENHTQKVNVLLQGMIERVDALNKVLHNPFGPVSSSTAVSRFKEPWLVESVVVWDRSTLAHYLECQKSQPPRLRKEIHAVPHKFAIEVLDWIAHLPAQKKEPVLYLQGHGQAVNHTEHEQSEDIWEQIESLQKYEYMISQAIKIRRISLVNRELEEMVNVLEIANEQGFKKFEQDVARQEQTQKEQTAELDRRLNSLKAEQKKTAEVYQKTIEETRAVLKSTQDTVNELAAKAKDLESRLQSANAQLQNANSQLGGLRNDFNRANRGFFKRAFGW